MEIVVAKTLTVAGRRLVYIVHYFYDATRRLSDLRVVIRIGNYRRRRELMCICLLCSRSQAISDADLSELIVIMCDTMSPSGPIDAMNIGVDEQ